MYKHIGRGSTVYHKVSPLLGLTLLFISLFLLACGSNEREKETIMLLHYFTGNFAHGFNELTEEINKESKNLHLVSTPLEHEEFKTSIRIQLETDNPPELFSYWAGAKTDYLIRKETVSPISSIFDIGVNRKIYEDSVLNACSYEGEIYLLPLTRHFVGFFYNKALFKKYEISPPETWDDLNRAAAKLKSNDIIPFSLGSKNRWPSQFWFDYILLRTAGFHYRQDLMDKRASYSDLEVLKTMDLWKGLIDQNFFNRDHRDLSWDGAAEKLINGEAAMTLMGTWALQYLGERKSESEYGFFPFPQMNSEIESVALGPIDGILLSNRAKNKEQALEILKYFTDPDANEALNSRSGAISPFKETRNSIYSPLQLEIKEMMQRNNYWAFNYDLATEPLISESGLEFFTDFLQNPEDYELLLNDLQNKISRF